MKKIKKYTSFFMVCSLICFFVSNLFIKNVDASVELQAKSAILMDENGNILFEKNSNEKLSPASVTKTMTILLAVEAVEEKRVNLDDLVSVSEHAYRQGGSQIWLETGEKMTFKNLLIATAVVSANDAAMVMMEYIYGDEESAVSAMNQRALALGLKNTHFSNVNGLPVENHYMSAYDTALIVKEAVKHDLYREVSSIKEYWLRDGKNWLVNTNKLLWWYEGADGLKTGWTEEAKYCFAGTAKRDSLRLISVVFAAPEPRQHLKESMKLLDWGFANYKAIQAMQKNEAICETNVSKGVKKKIILIAKDDINITIKKENKNQLRKEVKVEENITAPVIAGEKYGEVYLYDETVCVGSTDLLAQENVERKNFFSTITDLVEKLLLP